MSVLHELFLSMVVVGFKGMEVTFECSVQNGGEQGVQLGGGLGLQALQRVRRSSQVTLIKMIQTMCGLHLRLEDAQRRPARLDTIRNPVEGSGTSVTEKAVMLPPR